MLALGEHVEIIVCHVVLRGQIVATIVTAELTHRLQAGRTLVLDSHEVVVTVSNNRDAHAHLVAYLQRLAVVEDLASDGHAAARGFRLSGSLPVLGIERTPGSAGDWLVDGQRLAVGSLVNGGLDISESGRSLWHRHRLTVDRESCFLRLRSKERQLCFALVVGKEGIDGIDGVERCRPTRGAFLLQEPALHLFYGLGIRGLQAFQGFDGCYLCGDAVVAPTVESLRRVEVAPHLLFIDSVFLQTLEIVLSPLALTILTEDDCCTGLTVDGQCCRHFLQQTYEIAHVGCAGTVGQGTGIEIVTSRLARSKMLCSFLLGFFQFGNFFGDVLVEEGEGSLDHVVHLL